MVKSGKRICGSGAALANTPLQQNKSYFEVKLQSTGNTTSNCVETCLPPLRSVVQTPDLMWESW